MHAFQITFDNSMERQPIAAPSNVEFLNMADTSVRRLVKMAKHLGHFRTLDQEDQISLLKGAVVEVLVLRSSKMFNSETMAWQVRDRQNLQMIEYPLLLPWRFHQFKYPVTAASMAAIRVLMFSMPVQLEVRSRLEWLRKSAVVSPSENWGRCCFDRGLEAVSDVIPHFGINQSVVFKMA